MQQCPTGPGPAQLLCNRTRLLTPPRDAPGIGAAEMTEAFIPYG
jgi:hypothetical protein